MLPTGLSMHTMNVPNISPCVSPAVTPRSVPINANNKPDINTITYSEFSQLKIVPSDIIKHLPVQKFKKPSYGKPPVVIVACGSFSPPTYLHLRIMEEAKIRLSKEFEVIGGILSPVHDQYAKLYKSSLKEANSVHRVAMTKLATASSDWIGVSDYEASLDKWCRVALTLNAYGKAINYHFADKTIDNNNNNDNNDDNDDNKVDDDDDDGDDNSRIHLKFLGGSDLLLSMKRPNLWKIDHQELILGHHGMVVLQRAGHEITDDVINGYEMFKKHRNHIHLLNPSVQNTISSTVVRKLIKKKLSIKYLLPDGVIEYINKSNLYS